MRIGDDRLGDGGQLVPQVTKSRRAISQENPIIAGAAPSSPSPTNCAVRVIHLAGPPPLSCRLGSLGRIAPRTNACSDHRRLYRPGSMNPVKTAVSLFSGAGGMDLGVKQAGYDVLRCIELDPHCCETLRHNLGGHRDRVLEADIRNVEPAEELEALGLEPGELDLLFGGPPCQAFSAIGKKAALLDERGLLLFQLPRFAAVFKPQAVAVEQVKGLLSASDRQGKRGGVLDQLVKEFEELGYAVTWRTLNAADFGVAQRRERVFIVAIRGDVPFSFPDPTHQAPSADPMLWSRAPHVGVGAVLSGLPDCPPRANGHIPTDSHVDVTPDGDQRRINGVPQGDWLSRQVHLPAAQRGRLSKKDTTKFRRLAWDEPSLTLRCGEIFFHPEANRYLTPREYMMIHGYPPDYQLCGPVRGRSGRVRNLDQHRQIANSVPPPLARALAEAIACHPACLESSRSLGTR